MGRSRGPGVALAWVQTSGVGVPLDPPARERCYLFASVKGAFFFLEISTLNWKLKVEPELGEG